ncbi:4Fe-4S dicluster domain-containing protein [Campylobacter sputorum]|uniref:4Fe-4S dicluster domain-containing protein n=1 Tax=Campylobacter sputorum TaxID=206 RepID=UPI00053BFAFD|nr:4Fe-4S dicluster domain-containing protein [Campylobacter sputorum]
MKKLGFLFDQNFCIGCKACEIACQVYHNQDPDINWRHVDRIKIHEDGIAKDMYLSRSCHHCDNPACLHVCPVGAYKKLDNGVVEPIHDRCIGCGYCILACPYNAITKGKDKKAQKCNLCSEKLERGEEPACVEGCPVEVLKLVPSDLSDSAGMQKEMVGFVYSFTKPNIRFYPRMKSANFTK